MKAASGALATYLNSGQEFLMADLYTVTLADGTIVRYSNSGTLTVGGNTFDGSGIIIDRGTTKSVIGTAADQLTLTVTANVTHLLNGTPFIQACRQGALDGATVKLERLFMPTWGDTSLGTIIMFVGRIADMNIGRTQVAITVNSALELLNMQLPKTLFQAGCSNTLYDGLCTLVKSTFGVAATVAAGSTKTVIICGLSNAAGYFTRGTITFTSGALNGSSATISAYTPGQITLIGPLLAIPGTGDTFTAYPGCDKQQATCNTKFSNLSHFRGFPYIPAPEAIL